MLWIEQSILWIRVSPDSPGEVDKCGSNVFISCARDAFNQGHTAMIIAYDLSVSWGCKRRKSQTRERIFQGQNFDGARRVTRQSQSFFLYRTLSTITSYQDPWILSKQRKIIAQLCRTSRFPFEPQLPPPVPPKQQLQS